MFSTTTQKGLQNVLFGRYWMAKRGFGTVLVQAGETTVEPKEKGVYESVFCLLSSPRSSLRIEGRHRTARILFRAPRLVREGLPFRFVIVRSLRPYLIPCNPSSVVAWKKKMDEREIVAREPVVEPHHREGDPGAAVAAAAAAAGSDDDAQSEPGGDDDSIRTTSNSSVADGSESDDEHDGGDDDPSEPGSNGAGSNDGSDGSEGSGDEGFEDESFDEDDDDDDDDSFAEITFREAAELLEATEGPPIESMVVSMLTEDVGEEWGIWQQSVTRAFRRFVTALGRGEEGRAVREMNLYGVDWQVLPEPDVERLFAEVLPAHPTIKMLHSAVPAKYVKLLTSALPTENVTPLESLTFHGPTFNHESAQALADMIRRNAAVEDIILEPLPEDNHSGGLDASDLKLICQALPRNTKLRTFIAKTKEVLPDTLDGIASSSSLRHIMVYSGSTFPDECLASIARQLKTNTTLEQLYLRRMENDSKFYRPGRFLPLEEVLETHNFTLRTIGVEGSIPRWDEQDFVEEILRRNVRIQQALGQLGPQGYHVTPTVLVPNVFGMVSGIPTLLYRFLRSGNVNALCDLLQADRRAEVGGATGGDDADAGAGQG
jgi:hypothetical protein